MFRHFRTLGRWTRRHGFRTAQLALLAWIALELHGLNQAPALDVDPADVAEIADRLDDVVGAMQPSGASAGAETVALRGRHAGHRAARRFAPAAPQS